MRRTMSIRAALFLAVSISWAPAQDFDAAGEQAENELVRHLAGLAEWCSKNGLNKARDETWNEVIRLRPDHARARRVLKYRKRDGMWQQSKSYRLPKNKKIDKLPTYAKIREEGVKKYREEMLSLLTIHKPPTEVEQETYRKLLALNPDDAGIRKRLGEVKKDGKWMLKASADAPGRRGEIRRMGRALVEAAPKPEPGDASQFEKDLKLPWTKAWATDEVRVAGNVPEAEAKRIAQLATQVEPLFQRLVGTKTSHLRAYTLFVFKDSGTAMRFLEAHPMVEKKDLAFAQKLKNFGVTPRQIAIWDATDKLRLDASVRQTLAVFFGAEFGISTEHGWVMEGMGLYLSHLLCGTKLTWFVQQDGYSSPSPWSVRLVSEDDWLSLARLLFEKSSPNLRQVMKRNVNEMTLEEMLVAHALAAFLFETEPHKVAEVVGRVAKYQKAPDIIQEVFGYRIDDLEQRLIRFVRETAPMPEFVEGEPEEEGR